MLKPLSDGKSWEEMKEIWLKRYPEVLTKGWAFWTPVMVFSYAAIRAETLRFAFVTFAAYVWQVNLALLMNKNKTEVSEETEDAFEEKEAAKCPKKGFTGSRTCFSDRKAQNHCEQETFSNFSTNCALLKLLKASALQQFKRNQSIKKLTKSYDPYGMSHMTSFLTKFIAVNIFL